MLQEHIICVSFLYQDTWFLMWLNAVDMTLEMIGVWLFLIKYYLTLHWSYNMDK